MVYFASIVNREDYRLSELYPLLITSLGLLRLSQDPSDRCLLPPRGPALKASSSVDIMRQEGVAKSINIHVGHWRGKV